MQADLISVRAEPVLALGPGDIDQAQIVITFNEASKAPGMARARSWDIPSWNADYAGAKAKLDIQITGLIAELKQRPCRT